MHSNIERVIADAIKTYLDGQVAEAIRDVCPCVTFYDPMSIDEAHRAVVMVPSAVSSSELGAGNLEANLELVVKSRWAQPSMAADWDAHNARVKAYRDAMFDDAITRGEGITGDEIDVYFVSPEVNCQTNVREGWFVTQTVFKLQVGIKAEA